MKKKIVKEPIDYDIAWFGAFRYYLGRMTIATHCFIDALLLADRRGEITQHTKMLIVKEIETASRDKNLGMQMDADAWLNVYEQFK